MKRARLLIGIPLLLLICVASGLFIELQNYADRPAEADSSNEVVINVPQGQTLKTTADMLYQKSIIKSPLKMVWIARLKGYDKSLKAGEYVLSAGMSPRQILEVMVKGEVKLHKLTVPEGLNTYQIADLVAQAGFAAKTDFISAATDTALVRKMGLDAETFEGYLFPDTYYFPREVSVEKIISTMVQRFQDIFVTDWRERAKQLEFTVNQVVTLASIIEKETGAPSERALISSVFHNRLKKKMRLESDPTVIYGIKDFNGNLTRRHLKTTTPYNTYQIRGLPAGPIANPGRASLEAALYPEDTDYIYFVSKKDSTHQFSTNLKDHNRAVRKYQLGRN
ncbi:MAG: endolytic transglycosylase MltG [Desulfobacterales bacterium]|nr:MAG: endolytic transglycosylase MltG [Desulfobacterales bacterium]